MKNLTLTFFICTLIIIVERITLLHFYNFFTDLLIILNNITKRHKSNKNYKYIIGPPNDEPMTIDTS
jgi:hypothetical protein